MENENAYIVCTGTNGTAVIFGWSDTEPIPGQPFKLKRAKMILRWAGTSGLLGLAANGPAQGSTITAAVKSTGGDCVKQVIEVSDDAAAKVDAWPAA